MTDILKETENYRITRKKSKKSPYEYDFFLSVDTDSNSKQIITATEIANKLNFSFEDIDTWTQVLTVFAEAFIQTHTGTDGLQAVEQEYNI